MSLKALSRFATIERASTYSSCAIALIAVGLTVLSAWRRQKHRLPQRLIVKLGSEKHLPIEEVGGKAASLNDLLYYNFPVPRGIVLTTYGTRKLLPSTLQTAPNCSEAQLFKDAIRNSIIPGEAMAQIDRFAKEFPADQLFAVRSSGTHEDMKDAAFAGAYETFLGVKPEDIEARIKDCILSQYTPGVTAYLQQNGISKLETSMAVLVQPQVPAQSSGVCFTSAPLSPWHLIIEMEAGLAGGTDGRTTPGQFYIERESGILDAEKSSAQRSEFMTSEVVAKVARFALQIEEFRGGATEPRDIEFAVDTDQNVVILQDRPDTSGRIQLQKLIQEWPTPQHGGKWKLQNDKSYFPRGEGIPSLYLRPVAKGLESGYASLSGSQSVGLISFFEAKHRVFTRFQVPKMPGPLLRMLKIYLKVAASRQWVADVEQWHDNDRASLLLEELELKHMLKNVKQMSNQNLMEALKKAEAFLERASSLHRKLCLAAVIPHSELMLFCKDHVPGFDEEEGSSLSFHLMFEGEQSRSILTAQNSDGSSALGALVHVLRGSVIGSRLQNDPPKTEKEARSYLDQIQMGAAAEACDVWLDAVGHWIEQGTITTPTKAEEPMALLWALRSQVQGASLNIANDGESIVDSLSFRLKPALVGMFKELVAVAKKAYSIREERFIFASAAVGLFRLLLLEAGRRCPYLQDHALILEANSLDNVKPTVEQALTLEPHDKAAFVQALEQRKKDRLSVSDVEIPPVLPAVAALQAQSRNWEKGSRWKQSHLILLQQALRWLSAIPLIRFARICIEYNLQDSGIEKECQQSMENEAVISNDEIRGKAISTDNIVEEGKARVGIEGLQPEEILVVEETDVRLNHVFPILKGLVTERGGTLSHAAITAREYLRRGKRIACVVQVHNACSTIRTGDQLRVDARTGTVKILARDHRSRL